MEGPGSGGRKGRERKTPPESRDKRCTVKPVLSGHRIQGHQREYSSKPHKHSIVERTLVFKR